MALLRRPGTDKWMGVPLQEDGILDSQINVTSLKNLHWIILQNVLKIWL